MGELFLCSTGVYICQYSDRLDQHPWTHGKSGYIAIIKLTKVSEETNTDFFHFKTMLSQETSLPAGSSEGSFRQVHPERDCPHPGLRLSRF